MSLKSRTVAATPTKNLTSNTIKARFGSRLRIIALLASVACIAAALIAWSVISFAAKPPGGTPTNGSGPLTYTAGPFVAGNQTNNVNSNGEPTCTPAQAFPCDDYALT